MVDNKVCKQIKSLELSRLKHKRERLRKKPHKCERGPAKIPNICLIGIAEGVEGDNGRNTMGRNNANFLKPFKDITDLEALKILSKIKRTEQISHFIVKFPKTKI